MKSLILILFTLIAISFISCGDPDIPEEGDPCKVEEVVCNGDKILQCNEQDERFDAIECEKVCKDQGLNYSKCAYDKEEGHDVCECYNDGK